jgi:pilus assembly protein CpaC
MNLAIVFTSKAGGLALLACCAAVGLLPVAQATTLKMQVGEVRVLAIPDVARVAVGDGHVVNAVTTEEKEVIVFARHEGLSTLQLWLQNGVRRQYQVQVAPQGARQIQQELGAMMQRIPNATVSSVGDKVVVEGDELADDDRARVAALAKKYPQLVDMTGQVGWDRMVLLDVQVVELPRSSLQELGLRWSGSPAGGVNAGLAWEAASAGLASRPGEAVIPAVFPASVAAGYFGMNALLSARIQALAQSGSAVVLAQPQLLARSGATAEFLAGGEVPYSTTDANGNTNTVFKPYGVGLKITPQVERNGAVRSRIEVEVSSVDTAVSLPNGPSLKTRRAATEFNVRSGQTLVLAGFLSRELAVNRDAVPGLSQLPLIGALFGANRQQRADTELAIFVTPVVADADHPDMVQRVLGGASVLQKHFPDAPVLNLPIRHQPPLPLPVEPMPDEGLSAAVAVPGLQAPSSPGVNQSVPGGGWKPHSGPGSQWLTE